MWVARRQRPERERAGDHADQDEADDRRDPHPGESRDDDTGGAEHDQSIAEAGSREFGVHGHLLPFSTERR